jgi:peroxiredoxin
MNRTMRMFAVFGIAAAVTLAFAGVSYAAKGEKGEEGAKGVAIGAAVPDFKMPDCTGKEQTLSQHKGKVVVLAFTSQNCPYSRAYDPNVCELAKTYEGKEVVFLNIDSDQRNTPESIKKYCCEQNKFSVPVLKDAKNEYADKLNARRTPEMYVVDKEGKLAYHGAYDDRTGPDAKGGTNYVKDAVDAILAGQPVKTAEVKAWGCGINRVS